MTKCFEFDIDARQKEILFSPIRNKTDQIIFILNAIKAISISNSVLCTKPHGKLILSISKMSRLTCCSKNKIFSVSFPFRAREEDHNIIFSSGSIGDIDSISISHAISIFTNESLMNKNCISLIADEILDISITKPGFWGFIHELLIMEDGYIRFDQDENNKNGHFHPLNHLDIFYSSKATFKIGLSSTLNSNQLLDILDTSTECHYLNKVT